MVDWSQLTIDLSRIALGERATDEHGQTITVLRTIDQVLSPVHAEFDRMKLELRELKRGDDQ